MTSLPQHPTSLEYFAALVAEDDGFPLLEGAVAVGQLKDPGLDVQQVIVTLDQWGQRLARRIPADAAALQRLRFLNRYFFDELGFGGNVNNYYDPENSYVHAVMDSRRGIPISLALIYMELGQAVGLRLRGVNFPGHFLVKLSMSQGEVVIDPFTGDSLSREALDERLLPYRQRQGLEGDFEVPLGLFLQTATSRDILARLLRNLKEIHLAAENWEDLIAVLDRLVLVLPDAWEERRDRGLAYAELGRWTLAAEDVQVYVQEMPGADDTPALRERLQTWLDGGAATSGSLH